MNWLRGFSYLFVVVGAIGMCVTFFVRVHAPSYLFGPLVLLGLIGVAVDDIRKAVTR